MAQTLSPGPSGRAGATRAPVTGTAVPPTARRRRLGLKRGQLLDRFSQFGGHLFHLFRQLQDLGGSFLLRSASRRRCAQLSFEPIDGHQRSLQRLPTLRSCILDIA